MQDAPEPPKQQPADDGIHVFFLSKPGFFLRKPGFPYATSDLAAELPDGSRLEAVDQLEGSRIGFNRALPPGTWILLRGKRTWPVGQSE